MTPQLLLPTTRDLEHTRIRAIADGLLNLFYPESCLLCSRPISRLQDCGVCRECWDKALNLRITGNACPSCGLPYRAFEGESTHLCGKCTLQIPPFSGARSFGYYSYELSGIVQALKFGGRRNLSKLLAPLLASTFLAFWSPQDMDAIVPVPLHPLRRRQRGYNQAALLARPLARQLGLTFHARALKRTGGAQPQVGLSDHERAQNVRNVFRCDRPGLILGKRVLLIDDVMTTGATVASAAEALLQGGALRVSVLTVARTPAGWE
jgi:ComF family protein